MLKIKIPRLSRRKIQHIISMEQVTHNQKTVWAHTHLLFAEGDIGSNRATIQQEPEPNNVPSSFYSAL